MQEIVNFFILWLGNWIIIAMIFCLYLVTAKTFMKKFYYGLLNSIKFRSIFSVLGLITVFTIMLRETIAIPFPKVQGWIPQSFLWEQLLFYVYTTHLPSILLYSLMIFWFWRRYNSLIPALFTGFFMIGVIEFTFIPQHLVAFQTFLGFNWYSQFGVIVAPFIMEWKSFKIRNWKLMGLFLGIGFILQYMILLFMPCSLTIYDQATNAFRINYGLLPHPPIETWIFAFMQSGIKIAFMLGFSFIQFVKRGDKP